MLKAIITDHGLKKNLGKTICVWKRHKGRSSKVEGVLIKAADLHEDIYFAIDNGEIYFLREGDRVRIDYGPKEEGRERNIRVFMYQ